MKGPGEAEGAGSWVAQVLERSFFPRCNERPLQTLRQGVIQFKLHACCRVEKGLCGDREQQGHPSLSVLAACGGMGGNGSERGRWAQVI